MRILSGSVGLDGLRGGWRVRVPHLEHVRVVARFAEGLDGATKLQDYDIEPLPTNSSIAST